MARWRAGERPAGALRWLALAAIGICLVLATGCDMRNADRPGDTLARAWDAYKAIYIQAPGNVIDPDRGGGETTSEGQGYAMLRAAWMHDRETFVRTFDWTERHLARPDGLYSWLWTPVDGGKVLDANTAADADQEIAFALIIASDAFREPRFRERARGLLRAIRQYESVSVSAGWFPAAGNWAVSDRIVNLSYFIPYAYPYFARVDPDGRWDTVVEAGYDLIAQALQAPSARLIPDFMIVSSDGRHAPIPGHAGLSGDFSSDAMRIYWRVAVDCRLHRRDRACADVLGVRQLAAMLEHGKLFTRYSVDGSPLERVESSSFYGTALPFLRLHAPALAHTIETKHLSPSALHTVLFNRRRYFDANWVWFGLAAAEGLIETRTPPVGRFQ